MISVNDCDRHATLHKTERGADQAATLSVFVYIVVFDAVNASLRALLLALDLL